MAVVVVAHLQLDPVDLAGERGLFGAGAGSDRGAGLAADVDALVGGEDEG
jgi:hypothetical protein